MESDRARADAAHLAGDCSPEEPGHRLRRRARRPLQLFETAGRIQVRRWRRHVEERAVRRRADRRIGVVDGRHQSSHHVRRHVGVRTAAVEGPQRWTRKRPLQVHRRRRDLGADEGGAARRDGQDGDRRQPVEPGEGLRADRERFQQGRARPLRLDQCRQVLEPGHQRAASGPARLVLHRAVHRSQEREHDLRPECAGPALERRRQDLGDAVGHARGLSRSLDQSRQSEQLRDLERRRRGDHVRQGQELEHAKQHADGAVLPHQRRQSVPVPHLRRPTGQQLGRDRQPRVGRVGHFNGELDGISRRRERVPRVRPRQPEIRARRQLPGHDRGHRHDRPRPARTSWRRPSSTSGWTRKT